MSNSTSLAVGYKHEEFRKYTDYFQSLTVKFKNVEAYKKLQATSITFMGNDGRTAGYCYMYRNVVLINEAFWRGASVREREEVLLHELGHCVLGLDDTRKRDSIMQGQGFLPDSTYIQNYNNLVNKLFGCSPNCVTGLTFNEARYI